MAVADSNTVIDDDLTSRSPVVCFSQFNRSYKYDHMARLTSNRVTPTSTSTEPYTQAITYDAFSQMTARSTNYWGATGYFSSTYSNGRETTYGVSGTAYDAAGNQINAGTRGNGTYQTRAYDARKIGVKHAILRYFDWSLNT